MIKCRVHIENRHNYMDRNVFVEITLPCLPPVGSYLSLNEEHLDKLEEMVKSDLNIAIAYAPKWFYGKSFGISNPLLEDLENLGFDDAGKVSSISFRANDEFVDIELH